MKRARLMADVTACWLAAVPIPGSVQARLEPYRIAARGAPEG